MPRRAPPSAPPGRRPSSSTAQRSSALSRSSSSRPSSTPSSKPRANPLLPLPLAGEGRGEGKPCERQRAPEPSQSSGVLEPLRRHVGPRAAQDLPAHAPEQPDLVGRDLALVDVQAPLAVVARARRQHFVRALDDAHLVAADLAAELVA